MNINDILIDDEPKALAILKNKIELFCSNANVIRENQNPDEAIEMIKKNLMIQLTAPIKWTQTIQAMVADGGTEFIEVGPGKVLQGLMRKIDRSVAASGAILSE
jgi:malonyl CoA-acyl carrier protein transacylase